MLEAMTETPETNGATEIINVLEQYSTGMYALCTIRIPDFPFKAYGVFNKDTGLCEAVQPILYNAATLVKQFTEWMGEFGKPISKEDKEKTLGGILN